MEIRKLFKFEMGHVVRNCSTERCRQNSHGHSVDLEVFITSDRLDNAGMILDFGLLKGPIKQFIDSFDHCYAFWDKDDSEYKSFFKKYNKRWIELPFNPTAEMLALYFCHTINEMLRVTFFQNGEGNIKCSKVIYHETDTGYACATYEDLQSDLYTESFKATFSQGVTKDWSPELYQFITNQGSTFINPKVEQQVL